MYKDVKFYSPKGLKMNNLTGDKTSIPIFVADFRTITISFINDAVASCNFSVISSIQRDLPDITIPISDTNQYAGVEFVDLEDKTPYSDVFPYDPATNTILSKQFEVNTNGLTWIFLKVNSYVAGTILGVGATLFNNQ